MNGIEWGSAGVLIHRLVEVPEVFFSAREDMSASIEKKVSVLEIAFSFGLGDVDSSIFQGKIIDVTTNQVESVSSDERFILPKFNKEVFKELFRLTFAAFCKNYDNAELISHILAENCIAQYQTKEDGSIRGSFKMTVSKELDGSGSVSDFNFALSALRAPFKGMQLLSDKCCDVGLFSCDGGAKHEVQLKMKKEELFAQSKEVFDEKGSILLPKKLVERAGVCEEIAKRLGFSPSEVKELIPLLLGGINQLEACGFSFKGTGILVYMTAGGPHERKPSAWLIARAFDPKQDGSELGYKDRLSKVFRDGMKKVDGAKSNLFEVVPYVAASPLFGIHSALELVKRNN